MVCFGDSKADADKNCSVLLVEFLASALRRSRSTKVRSPKTRRLAGDLLGHEVLLFVECSLRAADAGDFG
jgi:hypothetical protein